MHGTMTDVEFCAPTEPLYIVPASSISVYTLDEDARQPVSLCEAFRAWAAWRDQSSRSTAVISCPRAAFT